MTKLIWLGEDDLHGPDRAGPSFTTWSGIKFDKNVPVEVTDADMIRRAKGNIFFKVYEGEPKRGPGRPPKPKQEEPKLDGD